MFGLRKKIQDWYYQKSEGYYGVRYFRLAVTAATTSRTISQINFNREISIVGIQLLLVPAGASMEFATESDGLDGINFANFTLQSPDYNSQVVNANHSGITMGANIAMNANVRTIDLFEQPMRGRTLFYSTLSATGAYQCLIIYI